MQSEIITNKKKPPLSTRIEKIETDIYLNDKNTNSNEKILYSIENKDKRQTIHSSIESTENFQMVISPQTNDKEKVSIDDFSIPIKTNNLQEKFSLVWSPIPLISTLLPFIGHTGITDSEGIIYDFEASKYVSINNMSFGSVYKVAKLLPSEEEKKKWDLSIKKVMEKYKKKEYSICGNNGEKFCANILNIVKYKGKNTYTKGNIRKIIWNHGIYVSKLAIIKNYLGLIVLF